MPNIYRGASIANRDPDEVTLSTQVFAITGEDRNTSRRDLRQRIGFYGSTRTYKPVFETHGWGDVCETLHNLSVEGRWEELSRHVTDEMIDTFCIEADWTNLRDSIEERYENVDRVSLYRPFDAGASWNRLLT